MGAITYQITSLTVVYSTVYSSTDQRNIKARRHWPLWGEFTGDWSIPPQRASNAENVSIWWRHHGPLWEITSLNPEKPIVLYIRHKFANSMWRTLRANWIDSISGGEVGVVDSIPTPGETSCWNEDWCLRKLNCAQIYIDGFQRSIGFLNEKKKSGWLNMPWFPFYWYFFILLIINLSFTVFRIWTTILSQVFPSISVHEVQRYCTTLPSSDWNH